MKKSELLFRSVNSAFIGATIAEGIGVAGTILKLSWAAGGLKFPAFRELDSLLGNRATAAVAAAFGYFGFREALAQERQRREQDVI